MHTVTGKRARRAARIAAQIERLSALMSLPMLLLVAGPAFLMAMEALRGLGG